jgi:transcriptional regulator with XRE-family HTH domain
MSRFDHLRFAKIIQVRLARKGWTGTRLATEAKISQSQVSRILNGKLKRFNPSHAKICTIMHLNSDSFLTVKSNNNTLHHKIETICAGQRDRYAALESILDQLLHLSQ